MLVAGVLAAAVFAVPATCCAIAPYSRKPISPERRRELEQGILDCANRVNASCDVENRSHWQEELCKKFIQVEDYDNALKLANTIYQCPGVSPERKAAHHYLIAEIYALKMEASPNVDLMEGNRLAAMAAAHKVLAQNYPRKWKVGEAAAQLLKALSDREHMKEVRAWVEKRQGSRLASNAPAGGARPPAAPAQPWVSDASVSNPSFSVAQGSSMPPLTAAVAPGQTVQAASQPAWNALMSRMRPVEGATASCLPGSGAADAAVSAPPLGSPTASAPREAQVSWTREPAEAVAAAPKKAATALKSGAASIGKSLLTSPIIIDGANVRRAEKKSTAARPREARPEQPDSVAPPLGKKGAVREEYAAPAQPQQPAPAAQTVEQTETASNAPTGRFGRMGNLFKRTRIAPVVPQAN